MQDILARIFIVFMLVMYAAIALVFVVAGIRKWIWEPIARKILPRRAERDFRRIQSTRRQGSSS
jgi:hypothetical protein